MDLINISSVNFNGGVHPKHELMQYYKFFTENIKTGSNVLDIGCGYGYVAQKVASKATLVTGIDFDKHTLAQARQNYRSTNLEFIYGDATTYRFKAKYDYIILSNVLEHIQKRIEFLSKIKKIAPTLLIRVPMFDRDWLPAYKKELGMFAFCDSTHFIEYTEKSFREEINKAGLKVKYLSVQYGEIWSIIVRK
jgi:SAM-dependent methyltransferase